MATEKFIPDVIIEDILSRLPVKSLLRFRCVCKPWCALITDPAFVKLHLSRSLESDSNLSIILRKFYGCTVYSIDLDVCEEEEAVELYHPGKSSGAVVDMVDYCNGLLCIYYSDKDIFFWNPSTRRHHKLPDSPIDYPGYYNTLRFNDFGFGYEPTTNDYKVVSVFQFGSEDDYTLDSEVKVYSLNTNSWRKINGIPFLLVTTGLLANSAIHWIANYKEGPDTAYSFIVALDLKDEEYRDLSLPDFTDSNFDISFGVLGGQLCLLCYFFNVRFEIWVMKDYGVRDSWTKQFTMEQPPFKYITSLCYTKNGEILLNNNSKELLLYDPRRSKVRNLMIRGVPDGWIKTETCSSNGFLVTEICVGSLVPLNDKDEVEQAENEEKEQEIERQDTLGDKAFHEKILNQVVGDESDDTHGRMQMAGTRVCPTSINVPSKSYDDVLRENAELRAEVATLKEDVNSLRAEVAMVLQLVMGNQKGIGNMYASDVGES